MPDGNDFHGITEQIRQIHVLVEKDVSQPGSGNESNGKVKVQTLDQTGREAHGPAFFLLLDQEIGDEKAHRLHQAIPSQMKRRDLNNIRIDVRLENHYECPSGLPQDNSQSMPPLPHWAVSNCRMG